MSRFAALEVSADAPARMTLNHPATGVPLREKDADGKPTGNPAWIDLLSTDSEAAKKHERTITNRRLQSRARKLTAEELEEESASLYATLTTGWNLLTLDGQPLDVPFSRDAARELYMAPSLKWVRDQVDVYVGDRGNYLKTSSTS